MNPLQHLGQKYGPLPLGAWAVIAGGAIGGVMLYRRRQSAAAATPVASASTVSSLDGGGLDNTQAGAGNLATSDSTTTTTTTGPTTNDAWRTAALQAALARGFTETQAENAIASYLQGGTLTASGLALINVVSGIVGPPPESVPIPAVGTTPKPSSGITPVTAGSPRNLQQQIAHGLAGKALVADRRAQIGRAAL